MYAINETFTDIEKTFKIILLNVSWCHLNNRKRFMFFVWKIILSKNFGKLFVQYQWVSARNIIFLNYQKQFKYVSYSTNSSTIPYSLHGILSVTSVLNAGTHLCFLRVEKIARQAAWNCMTTRLPIYVHLVDRFVESVVGRCYLSAYRSQVFTFTRDNATLSQMPCIIKTSALGISFRSTVCSTPSPTPSQANFSWRGVAWRDVR